jgi:cytidylate kinase
MKRNEKFVIAINRELGSGGRTVGRKLAERLHVEFYDKALIKTLEERYSLSVEEIDKLKGRSHNWLAELKRSLFASEGMAVTSNYILAVPGDKPVQPTTYDMFEAEQEILKNIAAEESCVIAGRSGFYVFRDHPNHLSILIQASMQHRIDRLIRKRRISAEEAREIITKVDEMRENYVKKYTGTSRYDTRNYDLVINMDDHTEDEAVEIIMQYIH